MDSRFYDDIGQGRPRAPRKIVAAILKTGVASVGGWVAGRLDEAVMRTEFGKKYYYGSTVVIFLAAAATEYFAPPDKAWAGILRQAAAGMAGWVGDDAWFAVLDFIGWGAWKPQKAYKAGDEVKHIGALWVAAKDIPYPPQAEPGKDSRWVRKAQGFRLHRAEDFKAAAQALVGNSEVWSAITHDSATIFGPQLEQFIGSRIGDASFRFTDDDRARIVNGMQSTLTEVVQHFGA